MQQKNLLLSREQRIGALRSIDAGQLDVGRGAWGNVVDLLMQVEFCTMRDGCFAYAEVLAARMKQNAGVSKATFFRTVKLAKSLGLLVTESRYNRQGQQSNEWLVQWQKVAALAGGGGSHVLGRESQNDTGGSHFDTGGSQNDTPNIRNRTDISTVINTGRLVDGDQIDDSKQTLSRAELGGLRETGNRILRKIGGPKSRRDRELVAKIAILSRKFGENWLWDAVEGVVRTNPRNRFGYLHSSLRNATRELGYNFDQQLARTVVPAELDRKAAEKVEVVG